jgi:hypothetical protein
MINVDDRLLSQLDANEFFLISFLTAKMNEERVSWYSNKSMCKALNWSMVRLQTTKQKLVEKSIITVTPQLRSNNPGQWTNLYKVVTPLTKNYTPTSKLDMGAVSNLGMGHAVKLDTPPALKLDSTPTSKLGNKVLNTKALNTEELNIEELKRESEEYFFSLSTQNIFKKIIEFIYPQFESLELRDEDRDEQKIDNAVTLKIIKKIRGAAREIYQAYKSANKQIPSWRNWKSVHVHERDGEPDAEQDSIDQLESYVEYCRATDTHMVTNPENLAERIIQQDWCTKLKQYAEKRFPDEYDPMDDFNASPNWVVWYFYEQQMVYVDRNDDTRVF